MLRKFIFVLFALLLAFAAGVEVFALTDEEISTLQSSLKGKPLGDRIALAAEKFIGTPYDPDPLGEYVTRSAIAADDRVDCMYLVFRAVEIALGNTPEEAIEAALDKRFRSKGMLENGRVVNYSERFEYGEDMICSGKWGEEVTGGIGRTSKIKGTRGKGHVEFVPSKELLKGRDKLKNGDIIFFVKSPGRITRDEIIGHMGIIKTEQTTHKKIYLIHASGLKSRGGSVKKILIEDYIGKMPFIGAKITRLP